MSDFNGWTNYETWRVNLELVDSQQKDADEFAEIADKDAYDYGQELRETLTDYVCGTCESLAEQYALVFMDEVNWTEIARHEIETAKETTEYLKGEVA